MTALFLQLYTFLNRVVRKLQFQNNSIQINVAGGDSNNYPTYKSAVCYIEANKDAFDTASGASKFKSTSLFAPIQTDKHGNISFFRGSYVLRSISFIKGHDPQVISPDFSVGRTAASVDWKKVWDPAVPSGRAAASGEDAKTGPIQNDYGDIMAMFNRDGTLQVNFENAILTISGTLRPVKR